MEKHGVSSKLVCDLCKKSFSQVSNLRLHQKKCGHKEKLFYCEECGKGFRDKSSLKLHQLNKHQEVSEEEEVMCAHCGKTYKHKSSLERHMTKRHPQAQ